MQEPLETDHYLACNIRLSLSYIDPERIALHIV